VSGNAVRRTKGALDFSAVEVYAPGVGLARGFTNLYRVGIGTKTTSWLLIATKDAKNRHSNPSKQERNLLSFLGQDDGIFRQGVRPDAICTSLYTHLHLTLGRVVEQVFTVSLFGFD
jgi:hypothetical protein